MEHIDVTYLTHHFNDNNSIKRKEENNSFDNDSTSNNEQNSGRWTKEEHNKFLEAFTKFGHRWKKVQTYVSTRTTSQIRSHAQKYLINLKNKKFLKLKPGRKKIIKRCENKIFGIHRNGQNTGKEQNEKLKIKKAKIKEDESIPNYNEVSTSFNLNFDFKMDMGKTNYSNDFEINEIEYDNYYV
jgi:SHAQKYF class myb-like DNA-binding protein